MLGDVGPGRGLVQPGMCVAARECVCADKRTDTEHDGLDSLQSRILSSLSPALHSHVVWKVNEHYLTSIWFFRNGNVEAELLIALAHHLHARVLGRWMSGNICCFR